MEQKTEEWFQARLGKVTASRIGDLMSRVKSGGYSSSRKAYMMELLCERLTGKREEKHCNASMQRGNELEPKARAMYMITTGEMVSELGIAYHPTINNAAASPDGLIRDEGLLEIKCPNTATHIDFLSSGKPKDEYLLQMQWQMACTGRQWCDFMSYDDRLPEHLSYKILRVNRDNDLIAKIESEVICFLSDLDKEIKQLGA